MSQNTKSIPDVLVVPHPDGLLEVFVDGKANVRVARMPAAFSREAERQSEDVFELLLPLRWRAVWQRSKLKVVSTTKALLPSSLARAFATKRLINALNVTPTNQEAAA